MVKAEQRDEISIPSKVKHLFISYDSTIPQDDDSVAKLIKNGQVVADDDLGAGKPLYDPY